MAPSRSSIDYQPLPCVTFAPDASPAGCARLLHEHHGSNVCIDAEVGDGAATEAAFARASHVAKLEDLGAAGGRLADGAARRARRVRCGDRQIHHHTCGGSARRLHTELAAALGVPEDKVRVVIRDVGGNFGTRGADFPEQLLVAWAARRVGRPVKWTSDRSEAFLSDYQGRDLAVEAELALDADGNFLAMRGANVGNLGALTGNYSMVQKGVEIKSSIYRMPAAHFRARCVVSNTAPTRPYRSAGRPEVMFVMERLIDIAARQCGFDRVELRRRNLVSQPELPYRNPFGMVYDSGAYHEVMEKALTLADWQGFAKRAAPRRERQRQASRHRHRQLRRHRDRHSARARRGHGAAGRLRRRRDRHRLQRPGARDELCPAGHRMARRADRQRAADHRRHRHRQGRRRHPFRPRHAACQHRDLEVRERDHRKGQAHRRAAAAGAARGDRLS